MLFFVLAERQFYEANIDVYHANLDVLLAAWPGRSLSAINMLCAAGNVQALVPYVDQFVEHACSDARRGALSLTVLGYMSDKAPAAVWPHVDRLVEQASDAVRGPYVVKVVSKAGSNGATPPDTCVSALRILVRLCAPVCGLR